MPRERRVRGQQSDKMDKFRDDTGRVNNQLLPHLDIQSHPTHGKTPLSQFHYLLYDYPPIGQHRSHKQEAEGFSPTEIECRLRVQ
jgi:hypothetical protein